MLWSLPLETCQKYFYILVEFEDDQGFIESNQGATTVTIDDPIKSRKQRKATGTAHEEEIDPLDSNDKTEVSQKQSQKNLTSSFPQMGQRFKIYVPLSNSFCQVKEKVHPSGRLSSTKHYSMWTAIRSASCRIHFSQYSDCQFQAVKMHSLCVSYPF